MRISIFSSPALVAGMLLSASSISTAQMVREIRVPGKQSVARIWTEDGAPHYAVSLDGRTFQPAQATTYELELVYERFDPLVRDAQVPGELLAPSSSRLFIVQYWTQGLEDYRDALRERGVEIHRFLARHANIVEMDPALASAVRGLDFVRSVRPFHPAYKLEGALIDMIRAGEEGPLTVNLLTMRRGGQAPVIAWIQRNGGLVEEVSENTYLMTATLDRSRLAALAALDSVQWVDRWSAPETDMNIARQLHGADYVENNLGYSGQGVRAEVMDAGCDDNHPDLPNYLVHNNNFPDSHGTSTSGIVFGKGIGNANARGVLSDGFLIIARFSGGFAGGSRYNHSGQLVNPAMPYQCVFQTNSWGGGRTTQYTSASQDMDQILFDFDRLSILQSQSNANTRASRPQAWAKNIISVGGINHRNTLTKSDDFWGGASIGPAADGRIKPDMASFYDAILTTTNGGGYTSGFGGTSGATPIIAGHLGLFYQAWSEGLFNNNPTGATVFANAPHNSTAKAVLVNTASQWNFTGATSNLTRVHQGWGHADIQNMAEQAGKMLVVDESDVLAPFELKTYFVQVAAGSPFLRATMVYSDPPGTTSSTLHRINNLNLSVLAPDGRIYRGNNGLLAAQTSTPGGPANNVDTVENVYIDNPMAGEWQVLVFAASLNQDSHVETPALDADFALAVSGIDSFGASCAPPRVLMRNGGNNFGGYTASAPQVGTPVNFSVDTQGFGFATFYLFDQPANRTLDSGYAVLVNPDAAPVMVLGPVAGPIAQTSAVVANDPSLCGVVLYSQALLDNGGGAFALTNSQDLVIGL